MAAFVAHRHHEEVVALLSGDAASTGEYASGTNSSLQLKFLVLLGLGYSPDFLEGRDGFRHLVLHPFDIPTVAAFRVMAYENGLTKWDVLQNCSIMKS